MTRECVLCGNRIRKGITLTLTEFHNSDTKEVEYTFCPKDAPAAAEFFLAEVKNRV